MKISKNHWMDLPVLVTGGASFIGSHLVDYLVQLGSKVTVVDDLSSGKMDNLSESLSRIRFILQDLEFIGRDQIKDIFRGQELVFHLAAVHGGRGFISSHPADVTSNLAIDHHVFQASSESDVKNVVYASTACVYPTDLQSEIGSDYKLKEADSDPNNLDNYLSADIEYGWSKLMGEIQMISFMKQYGMKGCPVRFVTAYGPRENETHAIIALIYKSLQRMNPFEIWGDGKQERDFTYVDDIVTGSVLASQISDCTPINLGTGRKFEIMEVAKLINRILGWSPEYKFDLNKPVGALSRALDNSRAKEILGWEPKFSLEEGLRRTIDWYAAHHKRTGKINQELLMEHVSVSKS